MREEGVDVSHVFTLIFSISIAETWKNCLEGATDFKEVSSQNLALE